uniref:Uncharacterized protein n=1 Tax=Myotis myotis TaxID=51298 RepID=A0A7J7XHR2_MYOMY|nr:hypothetical protein mMyoMyo1_011718 [Myotis myotis]
MLLPRGALPRRVRDWQDSQLPSHEGALFLAQGGSWKVIHSLAGSATGGQQAQVPAGSWLCDFRLVQTPLWSLFYNLEIRHSNSHLIRFLGQTILWGPCVFWTAPGGKSTKNRLVPTQPSAHHSTFLHPERAVGSKIHLDLKLPPSPHYSCSNRSPHPSLCTGHAPT